MSNIVKVLGIDIGGVISDYKNDGGRGADNPNAYLKSPPVLGALTEIRDLVHNYFGRNHVFLVSKCGWDMQQKTHAWLRVRSFFEVTGIEPDHAWYCLKRSDKADIAKTLGITHFIDDRLEVLSLLHNVETMVLFRPNESEVARYAGALPRVQRVENWPDAARVIRNVKSESHFPALCGVIFYVFFIPAAFLKF